MFGKLFKYEIKANGEVLVPAFLLGIGGSLALRLLSMLLNVISEEAGRMLGGVFQGLVALYALGIVMFSIGYVVVRFHRTMVGKNAYLTLTLPVSNTKHIWAKFLAGLIFSMLSIVSAAATTMAYDYEGSEMSIKSAMEWKIFFFFLILIILSLGMLLMETYCSCAVGGQFKNRTAASVVTYFIIHNATGLISMGLFAGVAGIIYGFDTEKWEPMFANLVASANADPEKGVFNLILIIITIFCVAWSTVYFLITRYLVNKKVNLE